MTGVTTQAPRPGQLELSPTEALDLMGTGAVLVDVREDHEWVAGHAPQATHMAMSRAQAEHARLPRDVPVVCVCHLGGRSASVATNLRRAGYDARNLSGGMDAWALAGLPVVDDAGQPGTII